MAQGKLQSANLKMQKLCGIDLRNSGGGLLDTDRCPVNYAFYILHFSFCNALKVRVY